MRRFGVILLSAIMVTSRPQDGATPGRGAIRFEQPNSRDLAGLSGLPYGDAAPSHDHDQPVARRGRRVRPAVPRPGARSEEHTSELQSQLTISYAVFCL